MEPAEQNAVVDGGVAAVLPFHDVMDLAPGECIFNNIFACHWAGTADAAAASAGADEARQQPGGRRQFVPERTPQPQVVGESPLQGAHRPLPAMAGRLGATRRGRPWRRGPWSPNPDDGPGRSHGRRSSAVARRSAPGPSARAEPTPAPPRSSPCVPRGHRGHTRGRPARPLPTPGQGPRVPRKPVTMPRGVLVRCLPARASVDRPPALPS